MNTKIQPIKALHSESRSTKLTKYSETSLHRLKRTLFVIFFNPLQSSSNSRSHSIQHSNTLNKINVITRTNLNKNTFDNPIINKKRTPNRPKTMKPTDLKTLYSTNAPISVATQSDQTPPTSNLGLGRSPIDISRHAPLFEFENENPQDLRRSLSRVLDDDFLA